MDLLGPAISWGGGGGIGGEVPWDMRKSSKWYLNLSSPSFCICFFYKMPGEFPHSQSHPIPITTPTAAPINPISATTKSNNKIQQQQQQQQQHPTSNTNDPNNGPVVVVHCGGYCDATNTPQKCQALLVPTAQMRIGKKRQQRDRRWRSGDLMRCLF